MEILIIPISIVAVAITLWLTSFFAKLMHAKKGDIVWIAVALLLGIALSAGVIIAARLFIYDDLQQKIVMFASPFLIFIILHKLVNGMDWAGAFTTHITALSVGVIAFVVAVIAMGKPIDKTVLELASQAGFYEAPTEVSADVAATDELEESEEEPTYTEKDLLNPKVAKALERQEKLIQRDYRPARFRVISTSNARGAIGYKVRLSQNTGKIMEGSLTSVDAGQLILKQNLHGGIATTPIAINSINKLEVYR